MSSVQQRDFKLLLVDLADQLHTEDVEKIIFTESLPSDCEKQSKFKTLLRLHMEGKICEEKLGALSLMLDDIKRNDLAKVVKEFAKAQKKKNSRKNPKPEGEKKHGDFKAHMERTVLLVEWLQDQMCSLHDSAETEDAQEVIQDIRDNIVEVLKKRLKVANSRNNDSTRNRHLEESSDSDSMTPSPPHTLKQQHLVQRELQATIALRPPATTPNTAVTVGGQTQRIVKKPIAAVENPDENVYYEVTTCFPSPKTDTITSSPPKAQYENSSVISSVLVTGVDKSPVAGRRRPNPLTKPPKPPPKPKILSKQSKESDTDDYTSTSTSTTGDSGFSDVKPFLKTALNEESSSLETLESVTSTPTLSPAHSTADGYYKTLHKEEVKVSYYKSTRDNRYQEMMKDDDTTESPSEEEREREEKGGEERVYENLRKSPPRR